MKLPSSTQHGHLQQNESLSIMCLNSRIAVATSLRLPWPQADVIIHTAQSLATPQMPIERLKPIPCFASLGSFLLSYTIFQLEFSEIGWAYVLLVLFRCTACRSLVVVGRDFTIVSGAWFVFLSYAVRMQGN